MKKQKSVWLLVVEFDSCNYNELEYTNLKVYTNKEYAEKVRDRLPKRLKHLIPRTHYHYEFSIKEIPIKYYE